MNINSNSNTLLLPHQFHVRFDYLTAKLYQYKEYKSDFHAFYYIGLTKKCLWFLSKNKRHVFHFHQELY